jgi:hypothetical protein
MMYGEDRGLKKPPQGQLPDEEMNEHVELTSCVTCVARRVREGAKKGSHSCKDKNDEMQARGSSGHVSFRRTRRERINHTRSTHKRVE